MNIPSVYQDEKDNKISIFSGSFRYFAPRIIQAISKKDATLLNDASTFEDARYTFDFLENIEKASNNNMLVNPLYNRKQFK